MKYVEVELREKLTRIDGSLLLCFAHLIPLLVRTFMSKSRYCLVPEMPAFRTLIIARHHEVCVMRISVKVFQGNLPERFKSSPGPPNPAKQNCTLETFVQAKPRRQRQFLFDHKWMA